VPDQPASEPGLSVSLSAGNGILDNLRALMSPRTLATAMAVGSASGLALLVVYFWRIRFLPIEGFSSVVALAGVVTASGALMALAFLAMWMVPWFVFAAASESSKELRQWLREHRSQTLKLVGASVALGWVVLSVLAFRSERSFAVPLALVAVLVLAVVVWRVRGAVAGIRRTLVHARPWSVYAKLLTVAALVAVSSAMPMYAALVLAIDSPMPWIHAEGFLPFLGVLLFTGLLATIANAWSAEIVVQSDPGLDASALAQSTGVGAATFFAAVAYVGSTSVLHDTVMTMISVRVPSAHIVLANDSCAALRLLDIQVQVAAEASSSVKQPCMVVDATVLSRVGDRWLIDCGVPLGHGRDAFPRTAFLVRAGDVLSWWQGPSRRREPDVRITPDQGRGSKCGETMKLGRELKSPEIPAKVSP
jgi:hypothetical protein